MGFPPKVKNTQKNIPDTDQTGATKDVYSRGSGGIPASLKIKNAGVKPAPFPGKTFINAQGYTTDSDGVKTISKS